MTKHVLTRRQLYDLIWSEPTILVAEKLGISDAGLAKICKRHRVPKPSRGYWAKLKAGKPVKQRLLVEIDDASLNRIVIGGTSERIPELARQILKRGREERARHKPTGKPATSSPPALPAVDEPHKILKQTARKLRRGKMDQKGLVNAIGKGLCGVKVAPKSVERALGLLNEILVRLQQAGFNPKAVETGIEIARGADTAVFTITERTQREKISTH